MWPWKHERHEAIGEPGPVLEVTPGQLTPGDEVTIGVQGPPGGEMWVDFELVPTPPPEVVTAPPEQVAPGPAPGAPPTIAPLPGNPPGPTHTPVIQPPTVTHSTASADALPSFANDLANVLSYALVFYGMIAGAMAANFKWGFLVTIALFAIVWYLRDIIISPLQGLIKGVILTVFHVIIEILDFVWEWLKGVVQFFGGDLVRAILQILMVASFLWVWEQASQIPVIGQLFTWIENTASDVLNWVEARISDIQGFFDGIRRGLEADIANLTKGLGNLGQELRGLVDDQINSLFARVHQSITGLRAQVLGQLNFVVAAVNLQAAAFAAAINVSPETARRYLAAYSRAHPHEYVANAAGLWASTAPGALGSSDFQLTPWDVIEEFLNDLGGLRRGVAHEADDALKAIIADIRSLHGGATPTIPPLDQELINKTLAPPDETEPFPGLPAVPVQDIPPVELQG